MRIMNEIALDDGVDEPDSYDWICRNESFHKHLYVDDSPRQVWISEPNNRPQDGRICDCEDAPCCGHYEL